jgi:riboflavin synthase
MFTGIIEEVGTVKAVQHSGNNSFIRIEAKKVLEDIHLGDSIAVNGVCLTVTHFDSTTFQADVMNETLHRSSLGSLTSGSPVDLERAMSANGRFGGHIVSGHIDGTGTISDIRNDGIAVWYTVSAKPEILRYIVEKGSVAIDGISLTVAKVTENSFSVSIIPHTASQTVLSTKKTGDIVNLENDIVAKYVEKLMKPSEPSSGGITMEFLMKNGF